MPYNQKYIFTPIKILVYFNLLTLLIFILGPVNWELNNQTLVVTYVLLNILSLYLGYKRGIKTYLIVKNKTNFESNKKFVYTVIMVYALWFIPLIYLRLGLTSFSILAILEKLLFGITNPSILYYEKVDRLSNGEASSLNSLNTLISPIIYCFIPVVVLYFKNFGWFVKAIVIFLIIIECVSWVSIGTNKGVVDVALIFLFTGLIVDPKLYKLSRKVIIILLAIIGILYIFVFNMFSRFGANENLEVLERIEFNVLGNPLKTSGFYENMAMSKKFAIMQVESYLSQGYFNLGLAFESPITWTFGFGNSMVGIKMWKILTNQELLSQTYLGILERKNNIDPSVAWHSIYVWLASDFTFVGVPFVIFFIGYLFAKSWLDSIYKRTIYANIVFCLFAQMIFYFFANNQVISFSFFPFIVMISLWIFKR